MASTDHTTSSTPPRDHADDVVRPLALADLPAAAGVLERAIGTGSSQAGIERLLRAVAFEDPWSDPELRSLALLDGEDVLIGLLLTCPRRLLFDGKPLRALCGSNVIVDPAAQGHERGRALIRASIQIPKDISFTDGAPDRARQMIERLGFVPLHLESLEWTSVLRPAAYWQERALANGRAQRLGRALALPVDRLLAHSRATPALSGRGLSDEPLTAEAMMEHLERLTAWARLRPDYDLPFLTWLLAQLADHHPQGALAARLVRRGGEVIGWHVSLVPPGGIAQSMQVIAAPEDLPAVLESQLAHVRELGAIAARGRLEAPLLPAITARRTLLRQTSFTLVRTPSDPAPITAIQQGAALFTRLDADWWIDPTGR